MNFPAKQYLALSLSFFFLACAESGTEVVDIPDVQFQCTTADCKAVTGGRDTVIIITRSGCAPDQVELDPVAVGTTTASCSASGCTGKVTSWRDDNGNSVTTLISTSYSICSRIDLNNSSTVDSPDEYSELETTILGGDTLEAGPSTWGVNY